MRLLRLKSLEAFEKAADGQATQIIIPSEIQGLAGLAKSVVEVAKEAQLQQKAWLQESPVTVKISCNEA